MSKSKITMIGETSDIERIYEHLNEASHLDKDDRGWWYIEFSAEELNDIEITMEAEKDNE